jgi:hypothetical protein
VFGPGEPRPPRVPGRLDVFVTRPEEQSNWLERDVLENTIERTDLPVSNIVVDDAVLV